MCTDWLIRLNNTALSYQSMPGLLLHQISLLDPTNEKNKDLNKKYDKERL